jgi:hypothetical protein
MGLIMLILIGVAPTAYALNRTMPAASPPAFLEITNKARSVLRARADGAPQPSLADARHLIGAALKTRDLNRAGLCGIGFSFCRYRQRGRELWLDPPRPRRGYAEHAQRHVPGVGRNPPFPRS